MPQQLWFLLIFPGLPTVLLIVWLRRWIHLRNKKTRLPFKDMMRPAGWSLQDRAQELLFDAMFNAIVMMTFGVVAFILFTLGKHSQSIAIGVAVSVVCLWNFRRKIISFANHSLGLRGEQLVGNILDQLSCENVRVFHDLEIKKPGRKSWNIDHVVLTPAGVLAFETKTRRKPKGEAVGGTGHIVKFDGTQLLFPGSMGNNRSSLDQSARNAQWLSEHLSKFNATDVPVAPVLVIPGWWVQVIRQGSVTVLNEKQIAKYLSHREHLPPQLFRALSAQLQDMSKVDFA